MSDAASSGSLKNPEAAANGGHEVTTDESAAARAAPKVEAPEAATSTTAYYADIFPGSEMPLPSDLGAAAARLAESFQADVWLLVQKFMGAPDRLLTLDSFVRDAFFARRKQLEASERLLLVIDSPGGYGQPAYSLARVLQRHCKAWTAVVPRYAKSAATLLVMGAAEIYMGMDAELGPLDAQLMDPEREEISSALDEVQALERMHSSALDQIDQTMQLLLGRTGKKVETLLPIVTKFVSDTMAPLLDKIDTVHYSQQSRVLKVAEDYATRLIANSRSQTEAEYIARHFVNHYSEHGFVIDRDEAVQYLNVGSATEDQASAIEELEDWLTENNTIALGPLRIEQGETDDENEDDAEG